MYLNERNYNWLDTIRIPFRCSPVPTIIRIIMVLVVRALLIIQIYAVAAFINNAIAFFNGSVAWQSLLLPIGVLVGIAIFERFNYIIISITKLKIGNALRDAYAAALVTKCASLPCSYIEDDSTWDLLRRVSADSDKTVEKAMDNLLDLFGITFQAFGFIAIIATQVWWVAAVICAISVPIVALSIKGGREQYDTSRQVAKYERRYEYLSEVLTEREYANERFLFGYLERISAQWKKFYLRARSDERKVVVKWLVRMKVISASMSLITFSVALTLLFPVSAGIVTTGLFIALIQAANNLVSIMSWNLSDCVNGHTKTLEYFNDVTKFANLPEVQGATEPPARLQPTLKSIEFRNVSFHYSGSNTLVLNKLSMRLDAGCHYAIVGRNGSGKTTLVKLLTGLYTDFEGDILINDKSIREYALPELRSFVAVLFQDFSRYYLSLKDNIAIGDMGNFHTEEQGIRIADIINKLDLSEMVSQLPSGIDTILGKLDESGVDLSGGQWQRLAMARAMLSQTPLCILDEPTASLDPISESRLYENFGLISKNKTTLFISHRLGSTRLADKIFVIEDGAVTQQGSHDDLMNRDGLYCKMYNDQRGWYQ